MATSSLDDLDLRIIVELQDDGRRAFRDISRALDTPEATIRTRVKKLQDQGILQILAFTDPSKLGSAKLALIFAKVEPHSHASVVTQLNVWNEVSYLSTTLGAYDLCVQVLCRDEDHLWEIQQKMRGVKGMLDVRMMQEIKVHKIRFTIPPVAPSA
jgi:Lrp/AsnC family transcriptional regulator, regulator for asnA, asnC and gidA